MANEMLQDGNGCTITFPLSPAVVLVEKELTPPGIEGGGKNDLTGLRNLFYRTFVSKKLKTVTDATVVCYYSPNVLAQMNDMLLKNQLIVFAFSNVNNTQWKAWGWVESFKPNTVKDGTPPEATVIIHFSNMDNTYAEVSPVQVVGTTRAPTTTTTLAP